MGLYLPTTSGQTVFFFSIQCNCLQFVQQANYRTFFVQPHQLFLKNNQFEQRSMHQSKNRRYVINLNKSPSSSIVAGSNRSDWPPIAVITCYWCTTVQFRLDRELLALYGTRSLLGLVVFVCLLLWRTAFERSTCLLVTFMLRQL